MPTIKAVARPEAAEEPLTIDQWFMQQDRAVADEFKAVKRNAARRKIDHGEMERRIAERMAAEQEELAVQIAIARAVCKKIGIEYVMRTNIEFKDVLVEGLERRLPGKTFDDFEINTRACKTEETKWRWRKDGTMASGHYWEVHQEVRDEMKQEHEAREALKSRKSDAPRSNPPRRRTPRRGGAR